MSGSPPDNRCGHMYSPSYVVGDRPAHQNCCWREAADSEETEKCLWHADPDSVEKTAESLQEARVPPGQTDPPRLDSRSQSSTNTELLDDIKVPGIGFGKGFSFANVSLREANLLGVRLGGANLSGANLRGAKLSAMLHHVNLSGANLFRADLSGANLSGADLSRADLFRADLSNAGLPHADLSGANLSGANLLDTDLSYTDLSAADLTRANLSGADLRGANLFKIIVDSLQIETAKDVLVDSRTKISSSIPLRTGFRHRQSSSLISRSPGWDARARGYEQLRNVFKESGLDDHHRRLYSYQRRARAKQAIRSMRLVQWGGNYLSRMLTGYGVYVTRVLFWTAVVILVPWYWYTLVNGWTSEPIEGGPLYYSIVTFVTSPPHPIPEVEGTVSVLLATLERQSLNQAIVLFQTYAGTVLIILLGYVLGNRDRV